MTFLNCIIHCTNIFGLHLRSMGKSIGECLGLNIIIRLKVMFLVTFLLVSCYAKSQFKLEIVITNVHSNSGKIVLELLDSYQKSIVGKNCIIQNKMGSIIIENLKPSKYAVHYIHDENSNGKFDTNWVGIPIEGYGFSNNAFGNFGPQPFDKLLFDVKGDTKIVLSTKY